MDLFTRKDLNTSLGRTGDMLLNVDEVVGILKKITPEVDSEEVRKVIRYLDLNGNGELDHDELDVALRRARREMCPRDHLTRLAELHLTNPAESEKMMQLSSRSFRRHARKRFT